jgi:hypothetical protein
MLTSVVLLHTDRAQRNREAAQASRERKRKRQQDLEEENSRLSEENMRLRRRLEELEQGCVVTSVTNATSDIPSDLNNIIDDISTTKTNNNNNNNLMTSPTDHVRDHSSPKDARTSFPAEKRRIVVAGEQQSLLTDIHAFNLQSCARPTVSMVLAVVLLVYRLLFYHPSTSTRPSFLYRSSMPAAFGTMHGTAPSRKTPSWIHSLVRQVESNRTLKRQVRSWMEQMARQPKMIHSVLRLIFRQHSPNRNLTNFWTLLNNPCRMRQCRPAVNMDRVFPY